MLVVVVHAVVPFTRYWMLYDNAPDTAAQVTVADVWKMEDVVNDVGVPQEDPPDGGTQPCDVNKPGRLVFTAASILAF